MGRDGRSGLRMVAPALLLCVLGAACTVPPADGSAHASSSPPTEPEGRTEASARAETRRVRLRLGRDGRLGIGALPAFTYDGRLGGGSGELTNLGSGRWAVDLPGESVVVPPLPMVPTLPELPLRVHISPKDLSGILDVCSGSLDLDFDARFQPEAFGSFPPALEVVTPLTTSRIVASGRSLEGTPLDPFGRARLVGIAPVPPTGDLFVDWLLGLPAPATAELIADLDVEGGLPVCPGSEPPGPRARLEIGPRSSLSIGGHGPFAYDGGSSPTELGLERLGDGRYEVSADPSTLAVPAVTPIPLLTGIRIEVEVDSLMGTLDTCIGELTLDLDARFVPSLFGSRGTAVQVRTTLTTGGGGVGVGNPRGSPIDVFGHARLVGVAPVEPTGEWFTDVFLGLPAPALAELDANLDLLGAGCPTS